MQRRFPHQITYFLQLPEKNFLSSSNVDWNNLNFPNKKIECTLEKSNKSTRKPFKMLNKSWPDCYRKDPERPFFFREQQKWKLDLTFLWEIQHARTRKKFALLLSTCDGFIVNTSVTLINDIVFIFFSSTTSLLCCCLAYPPTSFTSTVRSNKSLCIVRWLNYSQSM